MKKNPLDIYCLAEHVEADKYNITILVKLPLKDFKKTVELRLTPTEIRSAKDIAYKLNAQELGFNLKLKVAE